MLTRVASTHDLVTEYCYSQRLVTEQKQLWQHVMQRCWPQLTDAEPIEQFRAVVKATAEMIDALASVWFYPWCDEYRQYEEADTLILVLIRCLIRLFRNKFLITPITAAAIAFCDNRVLGYGIFND